MRLRVTPLIVELLAITAATPLAAQLRASRPQRPTTNLPRLMVANPHSFQAADSAASVRVGAGMREKLENLAEKWYTVVQRNQMNDALVQYAYPMDAVLPPLVAKQLAQQLQARAIVTSTLSRGEGGRVTVEARLTRINDNTGYMVKLNQAPNQSLEDLGAKVADSLKGAFNALPDAIQCDAQRSAAPAKAIEAAAKALKSQPNDGLAELCLAQVAVAQKAPADSIIRHLQNAAKGDRLSLEVWATLLERYQTKGDTAKTIETFAEMLRVAPTNQKLREEANRFFIKAGQPQKAEEIAREGIQLDPSNPDFQDLLGNACLLQEKPEKNKCAVDAFEQVVALDSTRADTLFYTKITFATSREPVDTARFLKWARMGTNKYPKNGYLLGQLVLAYGYAGPVDSLVSTTKRLVQVDSSDVNPVLKAVQALAAAKRAKEALELGAYVERLGDADAKQNLGIILAQTVGLPLLQVQPPDPPLIADVGRKAHQLTKPGSRENQLANYVLGLGLLLQIQTYDQQAVAAKTCEGVKALETFVMDAKTALTTGQAINKDFVAQRLTQIDQYYLNENPKVGRIAQMKKAFCK